MSDETRADRLIQRLEREGIILQTNGKTISWRAPKGAMTETLMGEIRQVKSALITRLGERGTGWVTLAPTQRRLYVLMRLSPERTDLNVSATVRFLGDLDIAALQDSLNSLLEDHDALRTQFAVKDGEAVQRALPARDVALTVEEHSSEPDAIRRAKDFELVRFRLDGEPTLRAVALRYADSAWIVQLNFHHLTCDQGSMRIAVNELLARYMNKTLNVGLTVNRAPASYLAFAREATASVAQTRACDLAYWKDRLKDLPPRARPASGGTPYSIRQRLDVDSAAAFMALAKSNRTTITAVMMAIFSLTLRHHFGREDILIGSPFNNRGPEQDSSVGMFINSLVIRLTDRGDADFPSWLKTVAHSLIDALQHANTPYDMVVDVLMPDNRQAELYDAWLAVRQGYRLPPVRGLSIEPLDLDSINANHTLKMEIDIYNDGILTHLIGTTAACSALEMEAIAFRFACTAKAVAAKPSQTLSALTAQVDHEVEQWSAQQRLQQGQSKRSSLRSAVRSRG
ncbi:condensation domain-containing protein [Roseovarius sp. M141]|uniref:condensation domain-containing protein n=1 Tax=Roseovarius sp. M141 TaxID=2583806 RepID=UPI0020CD5B8C|nr:condensation domain-containing protein [Roseovarius sp. M141]MCQ0090689.1 hypothetical protein [Roseovarius sp. M141]